MEAIIIVGTAKTTSGTSCRKPTCQIYAIGLFDADRCGPTPEERNGPSLLTDLTEMTGGRAFTVRNLSELPDIATKISMELRNQYVLGYRPSNTAHDGKWRKIKVKLRPPKGLPPLTVYAKTGTSRPVANQPLARSLAAVALLHLDSRAAGCSSWRCCAPRPRRRGQNPPASSRPPHAPAAGLSRRIRTPFKRDRGPGGAARHGARMTAANSSPDLQQERFSRLRRQGRAEVSVFSHEDIPVTMGLVIDNSGSMREKRAQVNAAALTFVNTSNPQDEAFVVNFNDEYYLDTDGDFTSDSARILNDALSRIDTRGSTALYDAVIGSLDHLKKGTRTRRCCWSITDGDDDASRKTFDRRHESRRDSPSAAIYAIGVFSQDDRKNDKKHDPQLANAPQGTRRRHRRPGLLSRNPGRRETDLRAGRARNPQPVHHRLLPDQHREGRHFPRRESGSPGTEERRQASSPHPRRILRAVGRFRSPKACRQLNPH